MYRLYRFFILRKFNDNIYIFHKHKKRINKPEALSCMLAFEKLFNEILQKSIYKIITCSNPPSLTLELE